MQTVHEQWKDVPPECLERICEAHWSGAEVGKPINGVTFLRIYQHNACNHTLAGTILHEGREFGFIIDNGDWNGTVVDAWGDPEDVGMGEDPEPPEPRTFLPKNRFLFQERPNMWSVYLAWRKESWFLDMERSYNYDRHFQPGGKIENHYRDKADKRGLRIGYLSELGAEERDSMGMK